MPQPMVAAMVPEPMVAAATVLPDGKPFPSALVDRPAFRPTEAFLRFVQPQDRLDLIITVLRTCTEHGQIGSRDIATACRVEPLAVLKVVAFLADQGLLADHDGLWQASPDALAEWQHRLDRAGRQAIPAIAFARLQKEHNRYRQR